MPSAWRHALSLHLKKYCSPNIHTRESILKHLVQFSWVQPYDTRLIFITQGFIWIVFRRISFDPVKHWRGYETDGKMVWKDLLPDWNVYEVNFLLFPELISYYDRIVLNRSLRKLWKNIFKLGSLYLWGYIKILFRRGCKLTTFWLKQQ